MPEKCNYFSNVRIENDSDKGFSGKRQAEIDFRSEHLKNDCIVPPLLKRI